jgi:hypothetical protein
MGLFKPAWQSKNMQKAIKAVAKINDPKKLEIIAKSDVYNTVRLAAIDKINDQKIVELIVKSGEWASFRANVVKRLTDPNVLADIAKNDKDWEVRKAAIETLNPSLTFFFFKGRKMLFFRQQIKK